MLHNAHFPYGKGEGNVSIMLIIPYTAETYPGFCNHKATRVLLISPGWDASPLQGYHAPSPPRTPSIDSAGTHIQLFRERLSYKSLKVKAQCRKLLWVTMVLRQTITTHNATRHCRRRFCAIVGQLLLKQLHTLGWREALWQ